MRKEIKYFKQVKKVNIISDTQQEFNGDIYYWCGKRYFQNAKTMSLSLHRAVWKYNMGEIPKGFHVHHRVSKKHNQFYELELLSMSEHLSLHAKALKRKPTKKCREKAIEWHKSEEGKKWHKFHYEKNKELLHVTFERICTGCGKKFQSTRKTRNVFCSAYCGVRYRKQTGVDDIERKCSICSAPFTVNKYFKKQTCSRSCKSELWRRNYKGSKR